MSLDRQNEHERCAEAGGRAGSQETCRERAKNPAGAREQTLFEREKPECEPERETSVRARERNQRASQREKLACEPERETSVRAREREQSLRGRERERAIP